MEKRRFSLLTITTLGIFAALSVVLVLFIHIPLFPAAPFLEFDIGDTPILIVSFFFGPVCGLILTVIVSVVQGLTVSAASGVYGIIMHFLSTGIFAVVAGLIYKYRKNRESRIVPIVALGAGSIAVTAVMFVANLLITPLFMNASRADIMAIMFTAIVPFNLIEAVANSILTYFIYKPISRLMHSRQL